jgi:hypothetical protein
MNNDKRFNLHWILIHEEVSSNETMKETIKKNIKWKFDEK